MEAVYNFKALEIGDKVLYPTKDGGINSGVITQIHYLKEQDLEGVCYKLIAKNPNSKRDWTDTIETYSEEVFKSTDEARAYLEEKAKKNIDNILKGNKL